jgi:hypothetical protein
MIESALVIGLIFLGLLLTLGIMGIIKGVQGLHNSQNKLKPILKLVGGIVLLLLVFLFISIIIGLGSGGGMFVGFL